MTTKTSLNLELAEKTLTLETGALAKQATAAVLGRLGDTMVLATIVEGLEREDLGYFPLTVEYVERLYAGGRIKGSRWVKREGRPSDQAILTARLIDRSIRPLFPKDYKKAVQIVVTVLSVDGENEPDVLSLITTSAALSISKIPWGGPIGAVRAGYVKENGNEKGEFLINPVASEIELSQLDMIVAQTIEKTHMIEAGASEIPEDVVLSAIEKAQESNKKIIDFINEFSKKAGQKKEDSEKDFVLEELIKRIEKTYKEEILSFIKARATKEAGGTEFEELINKISEEEQMQNHDQEVKGIDKKKVAKAVEYIFFKGIREKILNKKKRPDDRDIDEIRPIEVAVSMLPRTHGSAIFQRGDTQALTVVTLGSPRLEQLIESAEGEETKRYIHHYSMPPYSIGETGRIGVPSRREIGHGALAEKALIPVIPSSEKFPYTIRVVSEILSSNGSTSMAATCGSTLALMDAGVPILKPVAGIAMGMMSRSSSAKADPSAQASSSNNEDYVILTDIIGLEDFSGDMDFKVAGTDLGITAIQLDVKILGLTIEQIKETLEKAKKGRLFILERMLKVIPSVKPKLSEFAPKIEVLHIPVEKIGEVIGPGGRVIRNIIAQTGAAVDVEDDGSIAISGTSEGAVEKAVEWVESLTREVKVGEMFEGEVKRILPFGAFVEILPGKEGMVHVSKMTAGFVKNPGDVVSIGQKVKVSVIEVDEQGRINLSMQNFSEKRENAPQMRTTSEIPREEHPLTRQFKREISGRPGWRSNDRNRRNPRFRPPR